MNIIVRNMVSSDIEGLSRAFASQGWLLPSSIFENYYNNVLHKSCDMLIAEVRNQQAGYIRLEWVDAGMDEDGPHTPEIQEFIVLGRYMGSGVAEALIAEAERRVCCKTGETSGNTLMAIYNEPSPYPPHKCSFVLDGLFVGSEGKFVRAKTPAEANVGRVIRMRHKI